MDKKLRRLETFSARGNDGHLYSVYAYEHLRRMDSFHAGDDQWEPIGVFEYKLADGQPVLVDTDGTLVVHGSQVRLAPELAH